VKGIETKTNPNQWRQVFLGQERVAGCHFSVVDCNILGGGGKQEMTRRNVEETAAQKRMNLATHYRTIKKHDL